MNENKHIYYQIENINLKKTILDIFAKTSDEIRLCFVKGKNNQVSLNISCTNITRTFVLKSKFNQELIQNFHSKTNEFECIINPNDLVEIFKSIEKSDDLMVFFINTDNLENMTVEFHNKQNKLEKNCNIDLDSDLNLNQLKKVKMLKMIKLINQNNLLCE